MSLIKSIKFPFLGNSGIPVQAATDAEAIRSAIIQVLETTKLERPHRPTFGVNTIDTVFDNAGPNMHLGIEREIRSALALWEPRISVESVLIEDGDVGDEESVYVTVYYVILKTDAPDSVTIGG